MYEATRRHSFSAYFRWLKHYWWLAAIYVVAGLAISVGYFKLHPKWYQAQTLFVVNPELFNQGLLRRGDDVVLNQRSASTAVPLTVEPELRIARWLYSEQFSRWVTQTLFTDAIDADYYQVRRHLHYYRYQNDRFHSLHWSAPSRALAEDQLRQIMALLEQRLVEERQQELAIQLDANAALLQQARGNDYRRVLQQQQEVLKTRAAMLDSSLFSFIQPVTDIVGSPNAVYPQGIHVVLAGLFFWLAFGVTGLHIFLLRRSGSDAAGWNR
ncbi:hypothetical protein ACQ5ES_05555 [Pseudidiomarina sp. E22-M8]|uniref:hypothetical protein n=1 Tax=Pseudidiomarina sp. E22-M8 TaxID=3424768 RepID=UPI00403CB90F